MKEKSSGCRKSEKKTDIGEGGGGKKRKGGINGGFRIGGKNLVCRKGNGKERGGGGVGCCRKSSWGGRYDPKYIKMGVKGGRVKRGKRDSNRKAESFFIKKGQHPESHARGKKGSLVLKTQLNDLLGRKE